MTTWTPQYIPPNPDGRDDIDEPGWYVRTEWDEADEVRMVLGVHGEEEAARVAELLNILSQPENSQWIRQPGWGPNGAWLCDECADIFSAPMPHGDCLTGGEFKPSEVSRG